ncbi:SDR family NAD(P)-dependent oxidoreductase [Sinomonas terrae]|uniref:SDR family NAD(P)-dependent oxidoreductase n=1 Tax=Sinomonas terrae TaxID=2908838 RepID=UPI0021047BD1|nr:SDR family NAD(P)-dependent oxidoreductase [Sinomonas terrae]
MCRTAQSQTAQGRTKQGRDHDWLRYGGESGAGRRSQQGNWAATALAFSEAGASVAVASRSRSSLEAVTEQMRARGKTATAIIADVGDPQSMSDVVSRTVEEFGRLDCAFNNASDGPMPAPLADIAPEDSIVESPRT